MYLVDAEDWTILSYRYCVAVRSARETEITLRRTSKYRSVLRLIWCVIGDRLYLNHKRFEKSIQVDIHLHLWIKDVVRSAWSSLSPILSSICKETRYNTTVGQCMCLSFDCIKFPWLRGCHNRAAVQLTYRRWRVNGVECDIPQITGRGSTKEIVMLKKHVGDCKFQVFFVMVQNVCPIRR